ncbi:MAG: hypothetical protein ABSE06_20000 [Anaerolineaceae bacterium]|jgi:CheY-specific phosphatase CheX
MNRLSPQNKLIVASAILGAFAGGIIVVIATRAIPRIMSRMMGSMMQNMMSQMKTAGCTPSGAPGG